MGIGNPLAESPATDPEDRVLVRAKSGDRDAVEKLVGRHRAWIYNIALRMRYHRRGRSSFRTWLYRIAVNHVLNTKRGRLETARMSFNCYAHGLRRATDSADAP